MICKAVRGTKLVGLIAGVALTLALPAGTPQDVEAATAEVTISGKAYIFNHMDTAISGATIKVREFPKLSARTNAVGDYKLTVPDDSNITPYILTGEGDLTVRPRAGPESTKHYNWNEIDLQTFHPRGQNLVNVNFQTPADLEFNGLKALLAVPARADGRPEQCAIVTTASARDVRGVSYDTFWDRTPHGVPGATSVEFPAIDGPTYFNASVIPDPAQMSTSEDGGIVWAVVPTGTYRIVTTSPTTRFASFLATCRPGRVVNANPPWGAYELSPGEKPLGAGNVAASVTSAAVIKKGRRSRAAKVRLSAGEAIKATVKLTVAGRVLATRSRKLKPGPTLVQIPVGSGVTGKNLTVKAKLTDASGVSYTTTKRVRLPRVG